MAYNDATSIVGAIASVIAAVASIIGVYLTIKRGKLHFTIRQGTVPTGLVGVVRSEIYVSNPTKPIDKCKVLYNGAPLYSDLVPDFQWSDIPLGGFMTFHLPRGEFDREGKIIVKSGWQTILKTKVKKIPYQ